MVTLDDGETEIQILKLSHLQSGYIIQRIIMIIVEFVFISIGTYIQDSYVYKDHPEKPSNIWDLWALPEKFFCDHGKQRLIEGKMDLSPCAQQMTVSCWVSRPMEKSIFQRFMLICSVFSIILCTLDCIHIGRKMFLNWKIKCKLEE